MKIGRVMAYPRAQVVVGAELSGLIQGVLVAQKAPVRKGQLIAEIEAEVDEFDAGHVQLGQPVRITAEGYPGQSWQGVVEEIPDAVSEKNLKPLDPGRPTDVRVLRVKIAFKEPTPLKLGQRVEVEITLR